MKLIVTGSILAALFAAHATASPTAYLPIGKDNLLEYQVDKMFALTTGTSMSKPYRIKDIQLALRQLQSIDGRLHASIAKKIRPYLQDDAITRRGVRLRASSGADVALDNDRGNSTEEYAELSFEGVWRGGKNSIMQIGAEYRVDQEKLVAYNTFYGVSYGNLQLNLGYKEHWFSPFKHSAQVFSSNAKAPASISLGLATPVRNWWNFDFEFFYSELERVEDGILYQGTLHSGTPKLAGTHISIEPFNGWKIGLNRLMQFGGGPREVGFRDILDAYFDPTGNDNSGNTGSRDNELGDQLATITSTLRTSWVMPLEWYVEHGGEDTREHSNTQFGNSVTSYGIFAPRLSNDVSLRYEYTKMNSLWYVHEIYSKTGNTIDGYGIGHFAANHRDFNDGVPTDVHVLEAVYQQDTDSLWRLTAKSIDNRSGYKNEQGGVSGQYEKGYNVELSHSGQFDGRQVETTLSHGKDVYGENYTWLSVNVYW